MIFTTDRVQFKEGKLIVFEFYNTDKEKPSKRFVEEKMTYLKDLENFDSCYAVAYDNRYLSFKVKTYDNATKETTEKEMTYEQYKEWFLEVNGDSAYSKPLGAAKSAIGDQYVQKLSNVINQDYQFDFSNDDNGLELTTKVLSGNVTMGFDFDLFETDSKSIIEFLKRENAYLSNKTAHPARYPWNHQKFTSLWQAKNRLQGELFLVNYSDEGSSKDNDISVIEVIDYSEKEGRIISDIGYLLNGVGDLTEWLNVLKNSREMARAYLEEKPQQIRNQDWWQKVYSDLPKNKKKIGSNYISEEGNA